jgi:hypothetical protein
LYFCVSFKVVNHGSRWGNTARALAQWRHLVMMHKVTDVLHRVMHIAPYCPGGMAIKIIVNLPAFFVIIDSVVAHKHS